MSGARLCDLGIWPAACFQKRMAFKDGKMAHELHREAAEKHELAAQAHRTAAEHHEKGDHTKESWHLERAMEYSDHAYKLAKDAHSKSGQMVTL
jgi:hypothetical protein